jgi:hypothetical protein
MYVAEADVQAAIEEAQAAREAIQTAAPEQRRQARDRAEDLEERARNLQQIRAGIAHRQQERQQQVAQMQPQLKRDKAALDRSITNLSALAIELQADLARLQKATAEHTALIQDTNHKLTQQALYATDDTTAPGEHHNSGANGNAGVYIQDILYRPLDPIAITLALAARILGNMGGTSDLRNLHQLGQIARVNGYLDTRQDGFALPPSSPHAQPDHANGTATGKVVAP